MGIIENPPPDDEDVRGISGRDAAAVWLTLFGLLASVVLFIVVLANCAHAHDHDRPELSGWFKGLQSGKGPCCDGSDAYRVDDADWEVKDGRYRVRVPTVAGGDKLEWVDVPADAVVDVPNLSGHALAWPIYGYLGVDIRCFMPGPGM